MKTTQLIRTSILAFLFLALSPLEILAQPTITNYRFRPHVIQEDRVEPVIFEVEINASVTTVVFEVAGEDLPMYDDGTNGDLVANDSIYTITLDPQSIVENLAPSDVYRPFVGLCKPMNNDQILLRLNVFAEIMTDDIPLVPICRIDERVQASAYLINIQSNEVLSISEIFFRLNNLNIPAEVDFLNLIRLPSRPFVRSHFILRNAIEGIGLSIFESPIIGAANIPERLKGVNNFPIITFFDGANPGANHELGHQWLAYIGQPYAGCAHWRFSSLATSIMGFDYNGTPSCQGLNFSFQMTPVPGSSNYSLEPILNPIRVFNDLELYLMGLLPRDSVPPFLLFSNQEEVQEASLAGDLVEYIGPVDTITIEEIIEQVGPRVPSAAEAQKEFKVYSILFSSELLSREEMAFYSFFAKRAEAEELLPFKSGFLAGTAAPFHVATRGLGTLSYAIDLSTQAFPPITSTIAVSICTGENFEGYTTSGTYEDVFSSDGCDSLRILELTVLPESDPNCLGTTTEEISDSDSFFIFPNPTKGEITFPNLGIPYFELEVISSSGKLVIFKVMEGSSSINISRLPQGVYFFRLRAGNKTVVKRVVKI